MVGGDQCLRRHLAVMTSGTVVVDNPANPFTFGLAEARHLACLGLVEGPSAVRKYCARTVKRLRSDAYRRRLVRGMSSQLRGGS